MNDVDKLISHVLAATVGEGQYHDLKRHNMPATPWGLHAMLNSVGLSIVLTSSVMEWRPIASYDASPEADTPELVWIGEGKQRTLAYPDRRMIKGSIIWRRVNNETLVTWKPTHWMPAPLPPGDRT